MSENDVAIVGLAAHLPGARNAQEYWAALIDGVESVRTLSEEELIEAGVSREAMRRPGYVRAAGTLDDVFHFDPEFFGFSPKEAGIMDPQHRHFLMAAWEAMEDAGHLPQSFEGAVGVFAGCGVASYYMFNLLTNPGLVDEVGLFLLRHTGNDKDFLATRASYLFDLRGPSVNVQTACSTSLVATHLAVQHLLSGECDLALAGGVTIEIPHGQGYQYHEGEVLSPDGHCRAFDHRSQGTVFGSGTGVVALRRLDDALEEGDQIYAVIKGSAVNNDGSQKVGYLAPSVDGQAACATEALAVAEVDPETISYVECHGTGTPMGDPIEIAALSQAFGADGEHTGYCRIGSVKTNIGHLDTAAGVASLIKVALAFRHGELPPSLNFEENNPALELERSPFVVNEKRSEWRHDAATPRRAAVNSLGVGGTNAFIVLEEPPERPSLPARPGPHLLTLSARSRGALKDSALRLARHLRDHPEADLADVAWTLQVGRHHFAERLVVAGSDGEEIAALLEAQDPRRVFTHAAGSTAPTIAFMFPGGGTQYPRMAADLYASEPVFAEHFDAGLELLKREHGLDLRPLLFAEEADLEAAALRLQQPGQQLPAIFTVEHALAQLLLSWGLRPAALVGHSVGENTAACLSGTISFADCIGLVALRGRLTDQVVGGTVAVPLPADDLTPLLEEFELDLAVVNSPELSVVSGRIEQVEALEARLGTMGIEAHRVKVATAAHSRLLDPILPEFRAYLESIELRAPTVPWVSNRTGTWITDEEATDPGYWVGHLRHTVRFADCITTLAEDPACLLLEVGPGKVLSSLARMNPELKSSQPVISTMRHSEELVDDGVALLTAIGRLWAAGAPIERARLAGAEARRRVPLPTYPFQTQPFFIEPGAATAAGPGATSTIVDRNPNEEQWGWEPVWRSQDCEEPVEAVFDWLVFADQTGVGDEMVTRLRRRGDNVVVVRVGDSYHSISQEEYQLAPEDGYSGYEALLRDLVRTGRTPDRIAHLALLATDDQQFRPGGSFFHRNQELGFQSVLFLAQAWASAGVPRPLHLSVATMGAQCVRPGDRAPWFEQSTVLGPIRVMSRELADVTASTFDLDRADLWGDTGARAAIDKVRAAVDRVSSGVDSSERPDRRSQLLDAVFRELVAPPVNSVVAIRRDRRFVQEVRRTKLTEGPSPLRRNAVVLVTGGLGGIGLTVAEHLRATVGARLALLSRTPLPDRETWNEVIRRLGTEHPTSRRINGVRALEASGAEVLLLDGDVTDTDRMQQVTGEIRARFGGLHGVVHAAGVVDDGLIVTKTQSSIEDVLAPKVYGTLVLEAATKEDDLDLFLVFSSTSTILAPIGQVDYVAANSFLNAFAEARQASGESHVVALDWGVWNEVGMAADAAARVDTVSVEPTWTATRHPFFDRRGADDRGVTRLSSRWTTADRWFLDEHRTATGAALFPGSGYPELARAALAEIGVTRPFEIRDLTFLRPLAAPDGGFVDVETVLTPTEQGYELEVRERVHLAGASAEDAPSHGRSGWRRTGEASLLLYEQPPTPVIDLAAEEAACTRREGVRTHQQEHLRFGPRWNVIERVQRSETTALGWLRLDDAFLSDLDAIGLHPAMFDLGTGFAMSLIVGYTGERLWVPVGYRSIRVFGSLPQEVVSRVTARRGSSETNGFASFDVDLCDATGRVLVQVEAFTIKAIDGPFDVGLERRVLASEVELDELTAGQRHLSQPELVFRHNLSQGITPAEGKRALARVLASRDRPVVYVTSMDLPALRTQTETVAAAQNRPTDAESSAVFGRPALDSEFLAPRNDVEERLVAIWQELLGVNEIGVQDSFFDLGGHSLIAVRLFARVRKVFSVDFPISILFEAPTVEACAALIAEAMPAADATGDESDSTIVSPRPRFQHLVAMHPGEGGPKTPFFLVAGMFGNVLNLRHLAHLIGANRPFYGVQAKGLFGGDEPHDDFREMARAYLTELRTVQPHGPYLLGGFSGGGITAFEMAQQLQADGEEVGILVFLDTRPPAAPPLTARERLLIQRDRLRERGLGYVKEWAVNRLRWERDRRFRSQHGPEVPTTEGALHSAVIEEAFYRALSSYEPQPYDGTISLYRPKLNPAHVFGPGRQADAGRLLLFHDNGWGEFCDRVEVTEVPGDHDRMVLEPNVRVLAAHLRAGIDAAAANFEAVHEPATIRH